MECNIKNISPYYYLIYTGDLTACMSVGHMQALCWRPKEPFRSYRQLWTSMWVLELNPGLLEEQTVLLTTQPSYHPKVFTYN